MIIIPTTYNNKRKLKLPRFAPRAPTAHLLRPENREASIEKGGDQAAMRWTDILFKQDVKPACVLFKLNTEGAF